MTQRNFSPIISLICPIYKAETYLQTCVDSVIAQTFEDWELLLINDGSPDKSGKICDEYAQKDYRIKVYHKDNEGVCITRQFGIDHATGEYVIQIDPDDWIEKEMLQDLYTTAKEKDADMVFCDFYEDTENGTHYVSQTPVKCTSKDILKELFGKLHGSTCNKLIKLSCIKENNISFPKAFNFCEDTFFISQLLLCIQNVQYLPKAYYHYNVYNNNNSLVRSYSSKIQMEDFVMNDAFCELLKHSSCLLNCKIWLGNTIIARAFYGNIDTSLSFYRKYHKFAKFMIKYQYESRFRQFLYLMSCFGTYRLAFKIFTTKDKLKNVFK